MELTRKRLQVREPRRAQAEVLPLPRPAVRRRPPAGQRLPAPRFPSAGWERPFSRRFPDTLPFPGPGPRRASARRRGAFSRPSPDRGPVIASGCRRRPPAALTPPVGPRGNHLRPPPPRPARRRICRGMREGEGAVTGAAPPLPRPLRHPLPRRPGEARARPHLLPARRGGSGAGSGSGRRAPASRRAHPGPARAGPRAGGNPPSPIT